MPETPLKKYLLERVRRFGPLTFEQYMEWCLYHPRHGYYMQGRERTGVAGDYFTSPDLHPVFARLLARQAAEMWEILGRPAPFTWVEMGAGRGLFAEDFLSWTESRRPEFFRVLDYIALEPGAQRHERLAARLRAVPASARTCILENLDQVAPVTGCFFSNELVDAFPVHVVTRSGGRLKEIYVAADGEALKEQMRPLSGTDVAAAVARYAHGLEEACRAEMSLRATRWIKAVAERLQRGFVITIDYGDLAGNLYTSDRPRGTLLAYRGHQATEDFYSLPGEQDLTAHVNFSTLMDAGMEAGLGLAGYVTQEQFLIALGEPDSFSDLYDPGQSETEQLQARLKLKRLINPEGMGSIFKVLIQQRGVSAAELTGLKYQRKGILDRGRHS